MGAMNSVKEKWDSSGGNELISKVSSSIPQGTKDYLGSAQKQLFNRDNLRSITVFFGIGEERPFYVEKAPSLLFARLKHNLQFFYLNYLLVFAVLFVLTLIISPSAIIGIALLGFAWVYVVRRTSEGSTKVYNFTITQKQATIGMGIISAFVLMYLLSHIFWWTIFSGGFLISIHAGLRDASMHQDSNDRVEMSGDLSLEENAAFLNPVENGPKVQAVEVV
uniref:PRA1 family protein n=1 Tax=Grammatophora oceanica TaxID=210454 RepID=A0A7S1UXJ1_9STRA|mmetsp:Transcript_25470/g.37239  ORF Transcript_25470/g.37239 Transcript_25470/m.37239 type:complete len:221 (+) Transcript_25470:3-665(+)